jgi:predicted MPP superfamily phosphohydrolase
VSWHSALRGLPLIYPPVIEKILNIVKKALFRDLERLQDEEIKPNIVIFSGDLIHTGDFGYSEQRSDYEGVKSWFIDPLLELLTLDANHFFICPGNHDIQRSEVDKHGYLEEGLKQTLKSRFAVNELLDHFEQNLEAFARLKNFERFQVSIQSEYMRNSNIFFSTYTLEIANKRVGIACINSAWRAYGGEEDYGHLLIGERTIDSCLEDLADCDLRIGVVHHPFSCLAEFERVELKRRVCSGFNIWLQGHTHESEIDLVQPFNDNRIIFVKGGALYLSRDFYNGYSSYLTL